MIKVTLKKKSDETIKPQSLPYFAQYGNTDTVVFVTAIHGSTVTGYMVNGNSMYAPFEYFSTCWSMNYFKPIVNININIDLDIDC